MENDLTFITNDKDGNLRDRLITLIKDSKYLDILVGYFYTSGFKMIYPSIKDTEKIRILIGINTDTGVYESIQSHKKIIDNFNNKTKYDIEESDNSYDTEIGIRHFIDLLTNKKLEIRVYPEQKIHSKLYIMTFKDGDRDAGRVITGSSNLTQSGLIDNLEFNVVLKNYSDYLFAKETFENLWEKGIDVEKEYIKTVNTETWIKEDITPYQLYLKFLYEYFQEEINNDNNLEYNFRPNNFKELKYQSHAVMNAKKILEEYNGVFLSDVVGLGKTFMGTMLCQQLNKKVLILAPPHLIDENNQGSWEVAFRNFGFRSKDYKCRSIGVLDDIIEKEEHQNFDVILIDEAHRFRNENNNTYTKLSQICKGKKVILVTATPYNNKPKDLLSQIKLFQRSRYSTVPNLKDLEGFFNKLDSNIKKFDRQKDKEEYLKESKESSRLIRQRVLKYLMVRRTRGEIKKYYKEDLESQNMKFPEIANPNPIYYEFDDNEDRIFFETVKILSEELKYARYKTMIYFKGDITNIEKQGQENMGKFMKMLAIKRLESSFFAFRKTLDRFIKSYKNTIEEYKNGNVYISAKHTRRIFEYIENEDFEAIEKIIEAGKAEKKDAKDFNNNFIEDLESDLVKLEYLQSRWQDIKRDPKIIKFLEIIQKDKILNTNKIIIFSESEETAMYISKELKEKLGGNIFCFTSSSSSKDREDVMANFDANAKQKSNNYRILITTDILSEGINLHQSNVVINYDIPWNPIKIMQRVGRINRVDTKFEKIYTYTLFPVDQSEKEIGLQSCAEAKIKSFVSLLGSDAKLLTENEDLEEHGLFDTILSKSIFEEDEEVDSEIKYLQEIRMIRDKNPSLFEQIKKLPKKARCIRKGEKQKLITYFRKGKLQKFVITENNNTEEIDFLETAKILSARPDEGYVKINNIFYDLLSKNIEKLDQIINTDEDFSISTQRGKDNNLKLSKYLRSKEIKFCKGFTDEDEIFIKNILFEVESGGLPKKLVADIIKKIEEDDLFLNPLKLLSLLRNDISNDFIQKRNNDNMINNSNKKEIILSEYFRN